MPSSGENHPLRPVPRHRYQDFQVAGEGAMGLVYLALDTELNRSVAFKIVRPGAGDADSGTPPVTPLDASAPTHDAALDGRFSQLKARFLQEAWVTGRMEHPGIVPVYELGRTEGGVPYYTMRFVRGQRTLKTAIEELEGRGFEERLGILEPFLKLCDAVSYAHAKGVIHRDLKPENIALGEFGEVVVLDWGLAKLREPEAASREGTAAREALAYQTDAEGLGTLGYAAPEAVRGDGGALDERRDVYSLGVILFQILTGRLPFSVDPFSEYFARVTKEEPPSARSVESAVPEALDRLCAQALSRDRGARLPGVRELADGIRHWQTQSALERELAGLLLEAQTALSAAEDTRGPSRIRQTQRALEVLAAARRRRPDSARIRRLRTEARALRDEGIRETQRLSRRRLVLSGGVTLLVLVSIAAFVVVGLLNARRQEAEAANRATGVALAEAKTQREAAERESRAAQEARKVAESEAEEARQALDLVSSLVDGFRDLDPEGAGRLAAVLDAGIGAALSRSNPDTAFFLLEKASDTRRHGCLPLGAAMRDAVVPPVLEEAERVARRKTGQAHQALLVADGSGRRSERREARRRLDAAQGEHDRTLDEIASALRAGIGDSLPGATTVEQVQTALGADDVFVSYGRVKNLAVAVVVHRDRKELFSLGDERPLHEAVVGLRTALGERRPISLLLKTVRRLFVDPLKLPPTGGRVIVAPHGPTLLVPFSLILPERDVRTIPSAGAWLHLRRMPPARGEGVLAVADAVPRRGVAVAGARAEAEEVGTRTLPSQDATWTKLAAALASRKYWRAVHLTCAGQLAGSAQEDAVLLLTTEDADDGLLRVPEVARLDCRADLVVLSTASIRRSPDHVDAPTLDLPQAFLFAGARRVLFPTLFPDGEATRTLMVKFYELWNPTQERKGIGAAAALKKAQAFVRSQERWEHPYYWAGWVLWGLPE